MAGLLMVVVLAAGCSKDEPAPAAPAETANKPAPADTGEVPTKDKTAPTEIEKKPAGEENAQNGSDEPVPTDQRKTPAEKLIAIAPFAVAKEIPAGETNALVGKWELHAEDDACPHGLRREMEFCEDGIVKDPTGFMAEMNAVWKAADGRLTISVHRTMDTDAGENDESTGIFECDYEIAGSTLTLSNTRITITMGGATFGEASDQSATYNKVDAWSPVKEKSGPKIDVNPELHLQCVNIECGEILVKRFNDFTDEEKPRLFAAPMPPQPGMPQPPRLLCETCSSVMGRQIRCPYEDCEKWFLDPMELIDLGEQNFTLIDRTCSHCNRDAHAYWQEKVREEQNKK